MEPSMSSYSHFIDQLAGGELAGKVAVNRTTEHASVVLKAIFRKARHHVCILSSRLDEAVYVWEVGETAAGFLLENEDGKLDILIEQDVGLENHKFFDEMARLGLLERVTVGKVSANAQKAYTFNFVVADREHFRFEKDRGALEAIVQFSNSKSGAALEDIFQQLQSASDPVSVARPITFRASSPLSFG
jgi:hypothetical protein